VPKPRAGSVHDRGRAPDAGIAISGDAQGVSQLIQIALKGAGWFIANEVKGGTLGIGRVRRMSGDCGVRDG